MRWYKRRVGGSEKTRRRVQFEILLHFGFCTFQHQQESTIRTEKTEISSFPTYWSLIMEKQIEGASETDDDQSSSHRPGKDVYYIAEHYKHYFDSVDNIKCDEQGNSSSFRLRVHEIRDEGQRDDDFDLSVRLDVAGYTVSPQLLGAFRCMYDMIKHRCAILLNFIIR
eukprot:GHVU01040618.1.p1 GENE.GHVU01040618.1~~GHVU01040618.1.p1  ORF type:complete len:168 (+),score=21.73 GHVU01040618.1:1-504(+)